MTSHPPPFNHFHQKDTLYCTLCKNRDQSSFVFDHGHGSAVCLLCGCEVTQFQMRNASYRDRLNLSATATRSSSTQVIQQRLAVPKAKSRSFHKCLPPVVVLTSTFRNTGRTATIRSFIEFICTCFHDASSATTVERAIALYERNADVYETKYVAKPEIWAGALYFVQAEMKHCKLTYKEIAATFHNAVEPKRICKIAGYIRKHERDIPGNQLEQTNGNVVAVSRHASSFGMNFRQEKLACKIVAYIDEEELILGLNPLSILSVSFFLTICLSSRMRDFRDDVPAFIKKTLANVSMRIHIAQNTIRKGIREVQKEVLDMVNEKRGVLRVNRKIIDLVQSWEF